MFGLHAYSPHEEVITHQNKLLGGSNLILIPSPPVGPSVYQAPNQAHSAIYDIDKHFTHKA